MSLVVEPVADVTHFEKDGERLCELAPLVDFLHRFIAYPDEHSVYAHALWIAHAHVVDSFDNTPRLAFLSPEPGSGKSRAMEVTELLVPRAVLAVNATPAYVFRKISDDAGLPTLLIDEADAIFNGRKSDPNEDLRGLLNSGYRKGAVTGRAVVRGKEVFTEEFPSFCAVALAGLNALPETLMTRSIVIPMKRRKNGHRIETFRRRVNGKQAEEIFHLVVAATSKLEEGLRNAWPQLPDGIEDRDADLWEPLIAIADSLGGDWPEVSRTTALHFVNRRSEGGVSLGVRLLADIRIVMAEEERLATFKLLNRLCAIEDAPWGNLKGEPIDSRYLARTLKKYDIATGQNIRDGKEVFKGYLRKDFQDAWDRYLPAAENALHQLHRRAETDPTSTR